MGKCITKRYANSYGYPQNLFSDSTTEQYATCEPNAIHNAKHHRHCDHYLNAVQYRYTNQHPHQHQYANVVSHANTIWNNEAFKYTQILVGSS